MARITQGSHIIAAIVIACSAASPVTAQVESKLEIDKVTCREALKMDGDERVYTAIFFHGFISGKKNELVIDTPALSQATDKIKDYCIDNPSETLLKAFETIRK